MDPEIPAYAFWNARVAPSPLEFSTYFVRKISGLYASRIVVFGRESPTTQMSSPSTSSFLNERLLVVAGASGFRVVSQTLTPVELSLEI